MGGKGRGSGKFYRNVTKIIQPTPPLPPSVLQARDVINRIVP